MAFVMQNLSYLLLIHLLSELGHELSLEAEESIMWATTIFPKYKTVGR